jgi:hypothetical protein
LLISGKAGGGEESEKNCNAVFHSGLR